MHVTFGIVANSLLRLSYLEMRTPVSRSRTAMSSPAPAPPSRYYLSFRPGGPGASSHLVGAMANPAAQDATLANVSEPSKRPIDWPPWICLH
jgi:hypothetical protein